MFEAPPLPCVLLQGAQRGSQQAPLVVHLCHLLPLRQHLGRHPPQPERNEQRPLDHPVDVPLHDMLRELKRLILQGRARRLSGGQGRRLPFCSGVVRLLWGLQQPGTNLPDADA